MGIRVSVTAHGTALQDVLMVTTALTAVTMAGKSAEAEDWEKRLRDMEQGVGPDWSGWSNTEWGNLQVAQATPAPRNFDIAAQPLASALTLFGRQSGVQVTVDAALVRDLVSPGVSGSLPPEQALIQLLSGTGVVHRFTGENSVILEPAPAESGVVELQPLVVEGEANVSRFGDIPVEQEGFKADYQSSGTKTPLSVRETPQSISVTTRESIDARQARDVNSAVELSAGVTSGRSGQGGPFAGRGLSTGENFNLRSQELNENRDIRVDGFAVPAAGFDMAIVERVEVVKGAASMLYGQGSLGGFVNMVRKKPEDEFFAELGTMIGSYDTYRGEADINGPFDAEGDVLGRLTLAYENSGSFIDGVETEVAVAAPSLELMLGEDTRLLTQVVYQHDSYIPSQGVPLKVDGNTAKAPKIPRSWFIGIPSEQKSKAENILATMRLDHQINDDWLATLVLQGGWQDTRRYFDSYGYDWFGLADDDIYFTADTAHLENENYAGELRLDGNFELFEREHKLLVGIERNRRWNRTAFGYTSLGTGDLYDGDFDDIPTIPGGAGNQPFDRDSDYVSNNQAAYAQLILSVLDGTKLLAGVRYDQARQKRYDNIADETAGKKKDDAVTLRFGLTHDFTDNVTAYALYAQSFNPVEAESSSGAILDPETGESFEVGLKTEWFDDQLLATLAVFQQDLDNRPIPDPADPDNFSINGGLQRTRGIELEVSGSPYPGVTIGASAAFLDAEVIDKKDPNYGLAPYSSVDRILGLYASYELQEGDFKGLGAGITVINLGERSASSDFNAVLFGPGTEKLFVPGYTRIDLTAFYKGIPGFDFSFQVRNVTDEVYIERFRDVSGSNYFGSPRAFVFSGRATF